MVRKVQKNAIVKDLLNIVLIILRNGTYRSNYILLLVNLYGSPGAGKSTGAAYIFAKLKMLGINAELITEYAKNGMRA